MRQVSKILKSNYITVDNQGIDGFKGEITLERWKGSVIFSRGAGWEHASVSPYDSNIIPTWEEMSLIKDIFWKDEEDVIQIHPRKSQYVNNMANCLHLWRCYYKDMVLPPSCLVGMRPGQSVIEFRTEVMNAYKEAGERFM